MNWSQKKDSKMKLKIKNFALTSVVLFCTFNEYVSAQCSGGCVPALPTTIGGYFSGQMAVGSVITFTGYLSHDNDACAGGSTPIWEWDFDYKGTFTPYATTPSAFPTWTYYRAGTYTVGVIYIDDDGQTGNLTTFQITIGGLNRLYYLKDHLGSIRATVRGGLTLLHDEFSGTLSQWVTTLGSGYS